jgi:exosortase/archaeosortase family protein
MAVSVTAVGRPPFSRRPEVRFPLRFVVLAGVMAVGWAALAPFWPALTHTTAVIVAWVSGLVGLSAVAGSGSEVAFGDSHAGFRLGVTDGCTGVTLLMIFTAAVLAYPATRGQRTQGLAIGLPVLFVANLLRLVALGWVGLHARAQFDFAHEYCAQVAGIALVGVCWFGWVWFLADGRGRTTVAPRPAGRALTSATVRTRLRGVAPTAVVFCGVLGVLGLIGFLGHGVELWGQLVRRPAVDAAPIFGVRMLTNLSQHTMRTDYGPHYAALAAVMALFLVTPRVPWRARVLAAVLKGVPIVYLVLVTTGLMRLATRAAFPVPAAAGDGPGGLTGSVLDTAFIALPIAVPAILWHRWACGVEATEHRRALRPMKRRYQ